MRRIAFIAVLVGAACGNTTQTTPSQLNFNRPIDMAFACYGGMRITNGAAADPSQVIDVQAQPLSSCDFQSGYVASADSPKPLPPGQDDLTASGGAPVPGIAWYGFILQGVTGTVTLARWDTKPNTSFSGGDVAVLDADPLTPGTNGIAVGDNPVAIATDKVGCKVVTANAGSCDLSVVDIGSAVALQPPALVDSLPIKNTAGAPIRAKPAAMVAEPGVPVSKIGYACPATNTATGLLYIAYPGCHLVAEVDASTGTVVGGIQYDAAGVPSLVGGNVTCPDECGTGIATPGTRPVALDLQLDPRSGRRLLAIGAENSRALTLVELATDDTPASLSQIALEDKTGTLGVTSIAISPQLGAGGSMGLLNDDPSLNPNQFQFVYAVATDHTVRVADVLTLRKECDAQVDPRFLYSNTNVAQLECMPVGDPATPPRRPGAIGPGIQLIGTNPTGYQVPTSVAVMRVDVPPGDTRLPGPSTLIGYYGVVGTEAGPVYVFNIDDKDFADYVDPTNPLGTPIPLDIAHQLRDSIPDRGKLSVSSDGTGAPICDNPGPDPDTTAGNDAGPRAPNPPSKIVPGGYVASAKVLELPGIRSLLCMGQDDTRAVSELEFAAPQSVRDLEFPDLHGLRNDENWTLSWEGVLSLDPTTAAINGPAVRAGTLRVDGSGMYLDDQTRPFCNAGVELYDIVQLRGCDPTNGDADCPLGYTCFVHPLSQVTNLGACMLADEAPRLADACQKFLTSLRRYTVGKTTSGELVLIPRKHVLRTTPIDGCVSSDQCQTLANLALSEQSPANPVDKTIVEPHHWSCEVDDTRAPETGANGQPLKRCVEVAPNNADTDCSPGAVAQASYCFDGVEAPQACLNAPQRYELRAHEAFAVVGSKSGYIHSIVADASGNCVKSPTANPLEIGRIPLTAPACDPTADPRTGKRANGTFDPNPCSLTTMQTDQEPSYADMTACTLASTPTQLVTRAAQAIRFRNRGMTLTLVDPTYPGDAVCIGDRAGNLGNIPLVASDYQITFRATAGLAPLSLNVLASLPVKVMRGPTESIWVIDGGDYLSTSLNAASTRGKVFRIESIALNTVNLLQ